MKRESMGRLRLWTVVALAVAAGLIAVVVSIVMSGRSQPHKSSAGSFVSPLQRLSARSCSAGDFARIAWGDRPVGFARVECSDGWGLAAGTRLLASHIVVFRHESKGWTEVNDISLNSSSGSAPAQFANTNMTISPGVLTRLAEPFQLIVRQSVAAGLLDKAQTDREGKNSLGVLASDVISAAGNTWFALAYADPADPNQSLELGSEEYPDSTVLIYKWALSGWVKQGSVHGWMGPVGDCCGIDTASFTGSKEPDFTIGSGGPADSNWFAVVSDVGGIWHLVPFEYGYSLTTVVNVYSVNGRGVETAVDACSCASGPTTELYETYHDGAFRPASPPDRQAKCDLNDLQMAADPGGVNVLTLTDFACADGWALATGTGAGYTERVVGLFQAIKPDQSRDWRVVELDNGNSLGSYPAIYDIPLSLLHQLAGHFGAALNPEVASADLLASPALAGYQYLNGVVRVSGVSWYIVEKPTGSAAQPGADATIYRWSGSTWLAESQVNHVPASLNAYQNGATFEAVTVPGARDPGFVLLSNNSGQSDVLTDVGGTWHVARSDPTK